MGILDQLLSPIGAARFFEEHWTKSPVVVRGEPGRFADLFDAHGLDRYLNHRLRYFMPPAVQMYFGESMGGARVPEEFFTESIRDANRFPLAVVSPEKVRRLCAEGATLFVSSVHDGDPRVKRFATALSHELGETLRVDLFYTPPKSAGVHAHFDQEDVLVLQLEGEKEWHISKPTHPFPLDMPTYAQLESAPRMPDVVNRLKGGDLMYIPRGYWHATRTSGASSLHLAVRVACRTGVDLLRWAVDALEKDDPEARANLPLTLQKEPPFGYDPATLAPAIRALRDRLTALLDAPDFVTRFNRACVASDRPDEPYQFATASVRLTDETPLVRPASQRAILDERGDGVTLVAWGRELDFPRAALPALRAILAATRFTGASIAASCGAKAFAEIEPVVARLVAEGLVFTDAGGRAAHE